MAPISGSLQDCMSWVWVSLDLGVPQIVVVQQNNKNKTINIMSITHDYEVDIKWEQGRIGMASSDALDNRIQVATPPEFKGGIDGIWSPEHLLVAAANSCLMTTFLAIAENSKLEFTSFDSKAKGKLEMKDGKYMISEIHFETYLKIPDMEQKQKAERLLHKSENVCLISNSLNAIRTISIHISKG